MHADEPHRRGEEDEDGGVYPAFSTLCERHGLRATPQRAAVYRELRGSADHPSAETIFRRVRRRLPNVSFDTVNRTLLTFASVGAAAVVEGFGDSRRFDPDTHNHHRLVCVKCRAIRDVRYPPYDDLPVPPELTRDFEVLGKRVVLQGLCPLCRQGPQRG